jgi:serine protease Do
MTRKSLRTIIIIGLGIIAGALLYLNFGMLTGESSTTMDTLRVDTLYASKINDEVNAEISQSRQNSITKAVKEISPTVVGISVTQLQEYIRRSPFSNRDLFLDPILRELYPELFKDRHYTQEIHSLGSGFIISADGYILTNEHVVENATEILVTMTSGIKTKAQIVGTDPMSDVALLKIEMDNLPKVILGNSDQIILGEWAIAVGNPFGLFEISNRATVTVGVISALNRDFGEINGRVYQDMIQTDASINHGNSGGPLTNAMGEVIGMNAFIFTGSSRKDEGSVGIGFAIPINRITHLIDDLKKYHKIDRDFWIGIRVKNLDPLFAKKMGYRQTGGVIISSIDRKSPAEKAGLKLGDIIVQIGGTKISNDKNVMEAIFEEDLRVGDKMSVKVWRDGVVLDKRLFLESFRND